jgi:hypothetical protein
MAKDPSDRPAAASELLLEARAALEGRRLGESGVEGPADLHRPSGGAS